MFLMSVSIFILLIQKFGKRPEDTHTKKKNHTHTQRKTKKTEINNSLSSTHQRRYLSGGLGDYKSGGDGDCTSAYPLPTLLPLTKELERALPL